MTIYQILVKGDSGIFDSEFKMHSKNVYKNKPTQEQIDEFIKRCSDENFLDYLDIKQKYDVKILELELQD